jgi:ribosome-associated protein
MLRLESSLRKHNLLNVTNLIARSDLRTAIKAGTVLTSGAGREQPLSRIQRGTRALRTRTTNGGAPKGVAPPKLVSNQQNTSELLSTILTSLDDSKAEEVTSIDLDGKGAIADQMVIATGRSNRHVSAIADHLVEKLKAAGFANLRVEGIPQCDWVLVDSGDVVVHLFRPEVRSFYNLEKLWSPLAPDERIAV